MGAGARGGALGSGISSPSAGGWENKAPHKGQRGPSYPCPLHLLGTWCPEHSSTSSPGWEGGLHSGLPPGLWRAGAGLRCCRGPSGGQGLGRNAHAVLPDRPLCWLRPAGLWVAPSGNGLGQGRPQGGVGIQAGGGPDSPGAQGWSPGPCGGDSRQALSPVALCPLGTDQDRPSGASRLQLKKLSSEKAGPADHSSRGRNPGLLAPAPAACPRGRPARSSVEAEPWAVGCWGQAGPLHGYRGSASGSGLLGDLALRSGGARSGGGPPETGRVAAPFKIPTEPALRSPESGRLPATWVKVQGTCRPGAEGGVGAQECFTRWGRGWALSGLTAEAGGGAVRKLLSWNPSHDPRQMSLGGPQAEGCWWGVAQWAGAAGFQSHRIRCQPEACAAHPDLSLVGVGASGQRRGRRGCSGAHGLRP